MKQTWLSSTEGAIEKAVDGSFVGMSDQQCTISEPDTTVT